MRDLFFYHNFLLEDEITELYASFAGEKKERMIKLFFANLELSLISQILSSLEQEQQSSFFTKYLENPSDPSLLLQIQSLNPSFAESLPELVERTVLRLKNKITEAGLSSLPEQAS